MTPEILPTFPPRPSFYHRISGPSHRHGPSFLLPLVAGAGLSPSPCLRLPRPFPAPPSPLDARRGGPQRSSAPRRGCVYLHACSQPHPRLSAATRCPCALPWGKEGRLSARCCILQLLPCISSAVSVCVPGEISANTASRKRGKVGVQSASTVLGPLIP